MANEVDKESQAVPDESIPSELLAEVSDIAKLANLDTVLDALNAYAEGDTDRLKSTLQLISEDPTLQRSQDLFQEVGKLTRRLHDSLADFREKVGNLSRGINVQQIGDASDTLNSVIETTNEAAHKVISIVEAQSELVEQQKKGHAEMRTMLEGLDAPASIRALELLSSIEQRTEQIHQSTTDIMLAQEFQDLTGQALKRVVTLITEVESSLVHLVQMFGKPPIAEETEEPVGSELKGPSDSGCGQEDVDSLLAELGF